MNIVNNQVNKNIFLKEYHLPAMTVTGPCIVDSFCRVQFLIRHLNNVDLPTFGPPTTATTTGGGSNGVLSTTGI